jgi:hypothetical protein
MSCEEKKCFACKNHQCVILKEDAVHDTLNCRFKKENRCITNGKDYSNKNYRGLIASHVGAAACYTHN